jgi:hypothetical protein
MYIDTIVEDKIITVKDARAYFGGCIPTWQIFANTHNFIWQDVIRHGLKASQLLATDDAMAIGLVEYVYNRDNGV